MSMLLATFSVPYIRRRGDVSFNINVARLFLYVKFHNAPFKAHGKRPTSLTNEIGLFSENKSVCAAYWSTAYFKSTFHLQHRLFNTLRLEVAKVCEADVWGSTTYTHKRPHSLPPHTTPLARRWNSSDVANAKLLTFASFKNFP